MKLPMLVVGGGGDTATQRITMMLPVQFDMQLVPYRRLLPR